MYFSSDTSFSNEFAKAAPLSDKENLMLLLSAVPSHFRKPSAASLLINILIFWRLKSISTLLDILSIVCVSFLSRGELGFSARRRILLIFEGFLIRYRNICIFSRSRTRLPFLFVDSFDKRSTSIAVLRSSSSSIGIYGRLLSMLATFI
ncbi:hypothetical protein D3C84_940140 [compost metagenome]